jgi:hypothetical protein
LKRGKIVEENLADRAPFICFIGTFFSGKFSRSFQRMIVDSFKYILIQLLSLKKIYHLLHISANYIREQVANAELRRNRKVPLVNQMACPVI